MYTVKAEMDYHFLLVFSLNIPVLRKVENRSFKKITLRLPTLQSSPIATAEIKTYYVLQYFLKTN